ncbi:MAG: ferrous iron transport protein A [Dorea sp.]|nr:ferrous iron transport protein A [Dorea sp.]
MVLKEGKNHHTYEVLSIHIELQLERRLQALGLTEGSLITVLNNDKQGSLTAKFRGTRFALGKRIADNIEVREAETDEQNN